MFFFGTLEKKNQTREAESAFLVPWKRKMILQEAEGVVLVPWKRKIKRREAESVFFWYFGKGKSN